METACWDPRSARDDKHDGKPFIPFAFFASLREKTCSIRLVTPSPISFDTAHVAPQQELDGKPDLEDFFNMTLAAIQQSVIQLPPNEKAALIDFLWDSLDRESLVQRQKKWADESEARIDAFERGELPAVDGPGAIQELRKSLR